MAQLTISQARSKLLDMPKLLKKVPEHALEITRRGRPVLAVLPWDFYQSLVETLEILGDPEMAAALRKSIDDVKHGRLVSQEEARKRLGV